MEVISGGLQKKNYSIDDVEEVPCPLCHSTHRRKLHKEHGSIGVVKCKNCNLIYASPKAKNSETNYWGDPKKYYEEARLVFSGDLPHHRDRNYEEELDVIQKYKKSGKLLDVGTNMGFFAHRASCRGFDVQGIDPSESLSSIGKEHFGLQIENSYLTSCSFNNGDFDVVTMIDVFEHIPNPIDNLLKAKDLIKEDGIICIKVPNGNYNAFKLAAYKLLGKSADRDIFDAYEHVAHYTTKTFTKATEEAGLQIKRIYIPKPIHPPVWHKLTGHYFQYPSPPHLDMGNYVAREFLHLLGKAENALRLSTHFSPDLLFILCKQHNNNN